MFKKRNKKRDSKIPKIFKPPPSKYLIVTLKKVFQVIIFIISLGGLIIFLKGNLFSVKNLECHQNTTNYCSTRVYEFLEQYRGENILTLNLKKIKGEIKKNFFQASEISVEKKFPSTIAVDIKLKEPILMIILTEAFADSLAPTSTQLEELIQTKESEKIYLDSNCELVNLTKEEFPIESLPILVFNLKGVPQTGVEKNQPLVFAVKVTEYLVKNIHPFKIGQIIEPKMSIFLEDIQIIFSTKNPPTPQLESLQFILSRAKIQGIKYQKIDLRFDKPVVVEKKNG